MSAFSELMAFQQETEALSQVAGRLGWDQETVMPRGAANQRGEEMAAMESILHARRSDPRIGEWLSAIPDRSDPAEKAQLREIRRSFERTQRVPAALASQIARVASVAQGEWAAARASDNFAAFAPRLSEVVSLKREEAAAISYDGNLYDALLDDFEPGVKTADLTEMFGALRPRLVDLCDRIAGASIKPARLARRFDEETQMALARELAGVFGYDFTRGRIDRAVHPFSSGSGADVRITTRTDPDDPFNCIYSTIHEVGHACYEQTIDPAYALSPIGQGASMGVHESQSRIYENQLGRSRAFTGFLYDRMSELFGDVGIEDADAFYATVNRVEPGFIRTEADEVHYNLHVLLRFDLERDLIAGALDVRDLEEAWNARFMADFGMEVPRASLGCLQDVHWSVGLFGYFPTYTLGNVYAGCLHESMHRDLPELDHTLGQGNTADATRWLGERLQRYGALRSPRHTIEHAIGSDPSEGPLLTYLESKFSALYDL